MSRRQHRARCSGGATRAIVALLAGCLGCNSSAPTSAAHTASSTSSPKKAARPTKRVPTGRRAKPGPPPGASNASRATPVALLGDPEIRGAMDKGVVPAAMRRQHAGLMRCYRDALRHDADLSVKVLASFTIGRAGRVTATKITPPTVPAPLRSCLRTVVLSWRFPPPHTGVALVRVPFTLSPRDPRRCIPGPDGRGLYRLCRPPGNRDPHAVGQ